MILFRTDPFVPTLLRNRFRLFRIAIACLMPVTVFLLAIPILFPAEQFSYSFERNENPVPERMEVLPPTEGHIAASETFRAYAGTVDDFSSVHVTVTLDEPGDTDTMPLSLRRSFRSFFFPEGEPVGNIPEHRVLAIDGKPYLFVDESLYPLSGERTALSWSSAEDVLPMKNDAFSLFPKHDRTIGFRPGTLVMNRERLYMIDTEERRRPIPDRTIFEALGFRTGRVIPVSDDELAHYKPGPSFTPTSPQPEGTIFFDRDTETYFIIENGLRHMLGPGAYRDMLLRLTDPMDVSGNALRNGPSCTLLRHPFLRRTYRCTVRIDELSALPGKSFEFSITPEKDIRIRNLSITFRRKFGQDDFFRFLREARDRFLRTYGTDRNRTIL